MEIDNGEFLAPFDSDEIISEKDHKDVSEKDDVYLDMWTNYSDKKLRQTLGENKLLKETRLTLFRKVIEFLNIIEVDYFVCSGTALGVYRENGKMIPHDYDFDLGMFEDQFDKVYQNIDSHFGSDIIVGTHCPLTRNTWYSGGKEVPYYGHGLKRFKFYLSREGFKLYSNERASKLPFSNSLVHVDLFTFGRHPDHPDSFCFNWNIIGVFDYKRKIFPEKVLLPLREYTFEGITVKGPNKLKEHLEIEYGYLGKDARYNNEKQLYEKIPDASFEALPSGLRRYITKRNDN